MKRFWGFALALVLLLSTFSLAGCGSSFDFDNEVNRLQYNGYLIKYDYTDYSRLQALSEQYTNNLQSAGNDTEVWVERQAHFEKSENSFEFCTMTIFETKKQAEAYAIYLDYRYGSDDKEKVARHENVVVVSNSTEVQKNLNLEFK